MSWDLYPIFAFISIACWASAAFTAWKNKRKLTLLLMGAGIAVFAIFIAILWQGVQRPPLRTMGETRLWYAFFIALAGFFVYWHWKYRWLPIFTGLVASVFTLVNIAKPDLHSITLMPALQSPWFIPHVTVYIMSYAMLGVATIVACIQLYNFKGGKVDTALYALMDDAIYIGFGFLVLGLISGSIWAKEAWGNYWDWDPKETWAFITAVAYLVCIHMRLNSKFDKAVLLFVPFAFILLMMAWFGVNYLPAAQGSIHVYYT